MKKLLTAALAVAAVATFTGVLAACNTNKPDDAETAKKAINTVKGLYGNQSKETNTNYEVIGHTKANDVACTINWSVSPVTELDNFSKYVSVGGESDEGLVTINISQAEVRIDYTLKASVTVGSATESIEFERYVREGKDWTDVDTVDAKLDFSNKDNRTSNTNGQVWEQNGVKLTTTSDNTYANPVRLYAGSSTQIEYSGIVQIIFTCKEYTDNPYATRLKTSLEASLQGLDGVTVTVPDEAVDDKKTVTLILTSPLDVLEFTATQQIQILDLTVKAYTDGSTDAQKIAGANALLDLATKNYVTKGTYDLPATKNAAKVTWSVEGEGSNYVSITNDGKLSVDTMPEAKKDITLKATISSGTAEAATKNITISLVPLALEHAGTSADPYTTTDAQLKASSLADGFTTTEEYYVTGFVIDPGTYNSKYSSYNIYIVKTYDASKDKDSEDALYIYSVKVENSDGHMSETKGLNKGDKVTFKGKLQNYVPDGTTTHVYELKDASIVDYKEVEDNRTDDQKAQEALDAFTKKYNGKTVYGDVDLTSSVTLTIESSTNTDVIATTGAVTLPASSTDVTLSVKATCGTATKTADVTVTVAALKTFEAGTYKIAVDLTEVSGIANKYYLTGEKDGNYGATTTDSTAAAEVEVTAVEGGFTLMAKGKYIEVEKVTSSGKTYYNIAFKETATTGGVWTVNQKSGALTFKVDGKDYYLGTYTNNGTTRTTVTPSEVSYIIDDNAGNVGVTQFPVIYEKVVVGPDERTDAEKAQAALTEVEASIPKTVKADISLKSSVKDATFTIEECSHTDIIAADGTVTRPETDTVVTFKIKATYGTESKTSEEVITVTVTAVKTFQEGTYKIALDFTNATADDVKGQTIYFTGEKSGNFGATTSSILNAANVVVDKSGNGYTLKVESANKYISIVKSGNFYNIDLSETAVVWTYNEDLEIFTLTVEGTECYLGTYTNTSSGTTRTTIGGSALTYINKDNKGVTQFPLSFVTYNPDDLSAADKLKLEKDALTLSATSFGATGDHTLPVASTENVTIKWVSSNTEYVEVDEENGKITVKKLPTTGEETVALTATLTYGDNVATDTKEFTLTVKAAKTYKAVTDVSTLKANDVIIIACDGYAIGKQNSGSFREAVSFDATNPAETIATITLEDAGDGYFYLKVSDGYLTAPTAKSNQIVTKTTTTDGGDSCKWTIAIDNDGAATITPKTSADIENRILAWNKNNNSPRFACYKTSSLNASIKKCTIYI